jgi:hypothetical protein
MVTGLPTLVLAKSSLAVGRFTTTVTRAGLEVAPWTSVMV